MEWVTSSVSAPKIRSASPAIDSVSITSPIGRDRATAWHERAASPEVQPDPLPENFLQANLRRMGPAKNLLDQGARDTGADILIINEKPRGPPDDDMSLSDLDLSAQLVVTGPAAVPAQVVVRGRYHVGAAVFGIVVFSCYLPPRLSVEEFADAMDALRDDCGGFPRADLLIAGDFNAKVAP